MSDKPQVTDEDLVKWLNINNKESTTADDAYAVRRELQDCRADLREIMQRIDKSANPEHDDFLFRMIEKYGGGP